MAIPKLGTSNSDVLLQQPLGGRRSHLLPRASLKEPLPRRVLEQQFPQTFSNAGDAGGWRVGGPPRRSRGGAPSRSDSFTRIAAPLHASASLSSLPDPTKHADNLEGLRNYNTLARRAKPGTPAGLEPVDASTLSRPGTAVALGECPAQALDPQLPTRSKSHQRPSMTALQPPPDSRPEKRPSLTDAAAPKQRRSRLTPGPIVVVEPADSPGHEQEQQETPPEGQIGKLQHKSGPTRSKTVPASSLLAPELEDARGSEASEVCDLGLGMSFGVEDIRGHLDLGAKGERGPSKTTKLRAAHTLSPEELHRAGSLSPPSPSNQAAREPVFEGGFSIYEYLERDREVGGEFDEKVEAHMRQVFHLFQSYGTSEVEKICLADVLDCLGHLPPRAEVLTSLTADVSVFESYDYQEFSQIMTKYMEEESNLVKTTFSHHAAGPSHKSRIAKSQLQPLLRAIGINSLRDAIEDACQLAYMPKEGKIAFRDFLKILAAYRAREGTTVEELERAQAIFKALAVLDTHAHHDDDHSPGGERNSHRGAKHRPQTYKMRLMHLPDAVGKLLGIELVPVLKDLLRKLPPEVLAEENDPNGNPQVWLTLLDFLTWVRRAREADLATLWKVFRKADSAAKGSISPEQLIRAMPELQYTLMPNQAKVFLKQLGMGGGKPVPFDDFVRFVRAVRRNQGFSSDELQEMESLFRRFDYDDSNSIEGPELLDVMAHLGHKTSVEEVHELFCTLDVDRNGGLDLDEFLRFMRIHREAELMQAQAQYAAELEQEEGVDATSALDISSLLRTPTNQDKNHNPFSFHNYWQVLQAGRKAAAEATRHHAGFTQAETDEVERIFNAHGGRDGYIDRGGIMHVLDALNVPVRSTEERDAVFKGLDAAHEEADTAERAAAALDRGSVQLEAFRKSQDEENKSHAEQISFETLLYFLRSRIREATREARQRELEVISQISFTAAEVSELRNVFHRAVEEQGGPSRRGSKKNSFSERRGSAMHHADKRHTLGGAVDFGGRRRSNQDQQEQSPRHGKLETEDMLTRGAFPKLEISGVYQLLRSMGLRPSQQERMQLIVKAAEFANDGDAAKDDDSDGLGSDEEDEPPEDKDTRLDFALFLLLMNWIVTTDFAGFKAATGSAQADTVETKGDASMFTRAFSMKQGVGEQAEATPHNKLAARRTVAFGRE